MASKLVLPFLGESINEAVISRWLKKAGDPVNRGEVIAELETDKATMELEAPEAGALLKVFVEEGERAHTGDLLAWIGKPGETIQGAPASGPSHRVAPAGVPPVPQVVPIAVVAVRQRISPLARKIAKANRIALSHLSPSRPGARIVKEDVERYLRAKQEPGEESSASPTAGLPAYHIQFNETRRVTARRMTESAQIPQFSISMDVEMSAFLSVLKELETKGTKISMTALLAYLLAPALRQHPWLNARFDGDGILVFETIHLAVAAATGQGLTVPVLHGLECLALSEINSQLAEKADRARRGQLSLEDLSGSTFTLSNLGMYQVKEFIPLVNPPQAAILGVGAVRSQVLPLDTGGTRHVQVMTQTLSADHRVLDGAQAAEFLSTLKKAIESIQIDTLALK